MNADVRQELDAAAASLDNCEFGEAAHSCRALLRRLERGTATTDLVNEARSYLISALMGMYGPYNRKYQIFEEIQVEIDRLFAGFLSLSQKDRAAEILFRKVEFLSDNDKLKDAFLAAYNVLDLFGLSNDPSVQEHVNNTHIFLFKKLNEEELEDICVYYGQFLQIYSDLEKSFEMILAIDDALDGCSNSVSIKILNEYMAARLGQLSMDQEEKLRSRLAANYLYVGMFEDAINTCNWLFMKSNEDLLDHLLWCGEAYMKLGKNAVATMYFGEVKRALAADPNDKRAIQAQEFLNEIQSE